MLYQQSTCNIHVIFTFNRQLTSKLHRKVATFQRAPVNHTALSMTPPCLFNLSTSYKNTHVWQDEASGKHQVLGCCNYQILIHGLKGRNSSMHHLTQVFPHNKSRRLKIGSLDVVNMMTLTHLVSVVWPCFCSNRTKVIVLLQCLCS